jgi:hypothetical protein
MEKTSHGANLAFAYMGLGGHLLGNMGSPLGSVEAHVSVGTPVSHQGVQSGNDQRSPRGRVSPGVYDANVAGCSLRGGGSFAQQSSLRLRASAARAGGSKNSGSGGSGGGGGESFLVDMPSEAITCKIVCGDDVVRMTLTSDMSLGHVVDRLVSSVDTDAARLRLRYQDEEGEWCALNTDADLQECRVATRALGGSMRIHASATSQ